MELPATLNGVHDVGRVLARAVVWIHKHSTAVVHMWSSGAIVIHHTSSNVRNLLTVLMDSVLDDLAVSPTLFSQRLLASHFQSKHLLQQPRDTIQHNVQGEVPAHDTDVANRTNCQ